jgi:hypothetical protein
MNRYSIALSALLSSTAVSAESPWSYLSIGIPIALSDMAVSVVTVGGDNNDGNAAADDTAGVNSTAAVVNGDGGTQKKIVLTGGCISDKGNEWLEGDDGYGFYACLELTNKVCEKLLYIMLLCLYSEKRQHAWACCIYSESMCDQKFLLSL